MFLGDSVNSPPNGLKFWAVKSARFGGGFYWRPWVPGMRQYEPIMHVHRWLKTPQKCEWLGDLFPLDATYFRLLSS